MKNYYQALSSFCFILLLISSVTTANAQSFTNGIFDKASYAAATSSQLPDNWQNVPNTDANCQATSAGYATVDLANQTNPVPAGGLNGNPQTGNYFVSGSFAGNFISSTQTVYHEGVQQTVSSFTIGSSVTISLYQTINKTFNATDPSGSWAVYFDNTLAGITVASSSSLAYNSNNLVWDLRTVTFTPTATTHTIKFIPYDADGDYGDLNTDTPEALTIGLDNVSIVPSCVVSAASSTPGLCVGKAISPVITHTTTGASSIANDGVAGANGLPAGVSASFSGNTITISGTPTASGYFSYSILLDCGAVSATGTIIVAATCCEWTPANITTALWLDAADATTIATGATMTWTDKSGNGNDATQTVAGDQPITGTRTINTLNTLDFSADYFTLNTPINCLGKAIFVVVETDDITSDFQQILSETGTNVQIGIVQTTGELRYASGTPYWDSPRSTTAVSVGNPSVLGYLCDATDMSFSVNGVLEAPADGNNGSGNTTFDIIGKRGGVSSDYLDGKLAELIILESNPSAADRQKIEGYLAQKWGINLPVGHPYFASVPVLSQPGGLCEDLALWLKADSGVTVTTHVTAWDDQSGSNNHTTANNTPVLVSSAINYNPAVDFDGINEYFETSTTDILLGSQAYTKFAVVVPTDITANNKTVIAGSNSNPHVLKMNAGKTVMRHTTTTLATSTNSLQDSTPHLMSARYGVAETVITRLDGYEAIAGVSSTAFVDGKTQIGCRQGGVNDWDGYIAEAIEFSSDITDTDIDKVETYLAIKYGLTLDNTAGGTTGDYIATTGTTIWDADDNPSYHNNVIGIGREDSQGLYQKQSHSIDDTARIYMDYLPATNAANVTTELNDYSYIIMGDNQGAIYSTTASMVEVPSPALVPPSGIGCTLYSRLEREWKVTKTSLDKTFFIDLTLNTGAAPTLVNIADLRFLVDDDGDFSNGGTTCWGNGGGVIFTYTNPVLTITNIKNQILDNTTTYFTIASVSSATPLPVTLINFDANCQNEKAAINWTTASEINNDYFTIERSSDAENFKEIATVNGNGNNSNYSWADDTPINGTAYYRLKQTDFNGDFEYHGVRAVSCEQSNDISIYPNPFENSFTVQLSENTYPITVEIIDYLGRNVHSQVIESATNEIAFKELAKGTYFIKVFNETTQAVERIVKMK